MQDYRWRRMTGADLSAVDTIAAAVHPGLFERPEVLAEKLLLYPDGAWLCESGGTACGYLLSHPWPAQTVPPLDAPLGAIPPDVGTYYLHDLALLPAARGLGAAGAIVRTALAHAAAAGFRTASLVAVNDSRAFWELRGFAVAEVPDLAAKLAAYEPDACYMTRNLG